MAAGSLLTLLDDIASILDDVSILSKKAASKTAGVLGDDLALNAEQVSGVVSKRELPVVWAVAKGSFINKLILVPLALVIGTFAPWGITPLLMVGGLYLCFEGCEKLHHLLFHRQPKDHEVAVKKLTQLEEKPESESDKVKGAIRTDFVLSAEIIAITLGTVEGKGFLPQLLVLSIIAVVMTAGVYGLVAGIVKLDDAGLYLSQRDSSAARSIGKSILWFAPFLMKLLSVAGTAAMFLVGGGIISHGIPPIHHAIEAILESITHGGASAVWLAKIVPPLLNGLTGLVAGTVVLGLILSFRKLQHIARPSRK
ncbi:DUF808 domain-containing protein [Luteolibacter pohnpeiensis]|uniref:DUF808 domain-containing protein n=1 Tax=Luteolibacter pohnpeiensis TaxID=454153 RepID=A0A934S563_9BACT|nr:DUF808 domain-containing protein [Luteolibacter pohnpeiensis]MBK1880951.1 DUF808 domain-containing protein [Luteolibacter pohnpeiensis]